MMSCHASSQLRQFKLKLGGRPVLSVLIWSPRSERRYAAFVMSAKRLKRERKKPRKRKLKAKIDGMVRRIERVRSYKEEQVRRMEAGLKDRCAETTSSSSFKLVRFSLCAMLFLC